MWLFTTAMSSWSSWTSFGSYIGKRIGSRHSSGQDYNECTLWNAEWRMWDAESLSHWRVADPVHHIRQTKVTERRYGNSPAKLLAPPRVDEFVMISPFCRLAVPAMGPEQPNDKRGSGCGWPLLRAGSGLSCYFFAAPREACFGMSCRGGCSSGSFEAIRSPTKPIPRMRAARL